MASSTDTRWLFTQEQITNSPSRRDSIDADHELQQRQFTALFINDLGCKLKVTQLCINTAIIYMHRFFMIHSLRKFHPNVKHLVAASCLFFSCKVEEHPRPLKQFIDAIHQLLHGGRPQVFTDPKQEEQEYRSRAEEIIAYESCLIQTLGFNVLIHHAHPIIIKTCQMIKAPRDLAQTAYFMATNSLILTNFCIKYSSDKIACFCIYLACKWTGLKIPPSNEGHEWYQYVNQNINVELLEDISEEYLNIYNKCPAKIKKKLGFEGKNPDDDKKAHGAGGDAQQAASATAGAGASSSARPHIPQQQSLKSSSSSTNVNSQQQQQQSLSASTSSTQIKQEPTTTIKQEPHDTTTAKSYREHLESRTKQQQQQQQPPPQQTSQQQRPFSQQQQQQQQKFVQHPHQQKQHQMQPTNQTQNRNPSQKPLNSHNIDSNGLNQTSSASSTTTTSSSHTGAAINYSQYNIDKRQFAGHHHHNNPTTMSTGMKRASEEQTLSNSTSNNSNNNISVQPTPNKMAKYITPTEKSVS